MITVSSYLRVVPRVVSSLVSTRAMATTSTTGRRVLIPRPAATVLALAPTDEDATINGTPMGSYQVFMVQRSLESKFFPGAHVFPGGAVEGSDNKEHWHTLFGDEFGKELPYRLAAVREVFEETGVLLTNPPTACDSIPQHKLDTWRARVNQHPDSLLRLCIEEEVAPAVRTLMPWSRWITPPRAPRRYDTMFYLAPLPHCPTGAVHDDGETISSEWFTPDGALAALSDGRITLPPPTYMTLKQLSSYPTFEALRAVCESVEATQVGDVRIGLPGQVQPDVGSPLAQPGV